MKLEEAIEILKQNKEIMEMISPPDKQTESLMLAIQALEKQVAKKLIEASEFTNDYVFDATICPTCDERVWAHYSHCPNCGQKIDWSEEE